MREGLRWLLDTEADLRVIGEAADSTEAILRTLELKPDLVIADLDLPGINGYTVARMLKQLPQPPLIVLLTITQNQYQGLPPSDFRQYCDGVIEQSTDWPDLLQRIRHILSGQDTAFPSESG